MFIQTEHIYLRALEPSDLELLYACENNREVWKVSNTIAPFSKHILQQYLEAAQNDIYTNKQLRLMICKVQSHQCIGTIDLFDFEPLHGRVGVGILIFEQFRKQGFAIEAIDLVKQYVFDTLLLKQLYCNISASNIESIALFEKCGFKQIGLKKQWNRLSTNEYEDEWMYQLIN
jgi:diamine N-acetyltransferase